MSTPAKLRPGKVDAHAEWITPSLPADLRLPTWVEAAKFLPGLEQDLEAYESAMTAARLSTRVQEQRLVAVQWLKDALRDLKRGSIVRLRNHPSAPMPGDAGPACWMQAHKIGLNWDELVRGEDVDAERAALLAELVTKAIATMDAERATKPARPRGRKPKTARDQLLNQVAARLQQFRIPDPELAELSRPVSIGEARRAADDILIGCGVPSASPEQNQKSLARAARRGAVRR